MTIVEELVGFVGMLTTIVVLACVLEYFPWK